LSKMLLRLLADVTGAGRSIAPCRTSSVRRWRNLRGTATRSGSITKRRGRKKIGGRSSSGTGVDGSSYGALKLFVAVCAVCAAHEGQREPAFLPLRLSEEGHSHQRDEDATTSSSRIPFFHFPSISPSSCADTSLRPFLKVQDPLRSPIPPSSVLPVLLLSLFLLLHIAGTTNRWHLSFENPTSRHLNSTCQPH
jgi:hypothetical protein